jgi:hypothetical protein
MTSSKHNHLPKAPPPNTITLRVRASTYDFWEDTIQSTALSKHAFYLEGWRRRRWWL